MNLPNNPFPDPNFGVKTGGDAWFLPFQFWMAIGLAALVTILYFASVIRDRRKRRSELAGQPPATGPRRRPPFFRRLTRWLLGSRY